MGAGDGADLGGRIGCRVNESEASLGRLVEAGDAVEHRGLAGAVGADDGRNIAVPGRKRQIVHGDEAPEAHGQVLNGEDRVGLSRHQPCPSLTREPAMAFRSLSTTDGSRWAMRPRGRHTIMATMARPKMRRRYSFGSNPS